MISRLGNADELCSADFTSADSDLPVCSDTGSENWEADFLAQIGPKGKTECISPVSDEEEEGE